MFEVLHTREQLNDANTRQTSLLEQGDGSKLHRPSDNPVDYSKFIRFDTCTFPFFLLCFSML